MTTGRTGLAVDKKQHTPVVARRRSHKSIMKASIHYLHNIHYAKLTVQRN